MLSLSFLILEVEAEVETEAEAEIEQSLPFHDIDSMFPSYTCEQLMSDSNLEKEIQKKLGTGQIFGVHFKNVMNEWILQYPEKFRDLKVKPVLTSLISDGNSF